MNIRRFTLVLGIFLALALAKTAQAASVSINPPASPSALVSTELQAIVTVDQTNVHPPASVLLTFIVTNTGANTARNVSIDNLLPVEFRYHRSADANDLLTLGDLAPGDSLTKSLSVDIDATVRSNRYVDEAIVSAENADSIESTVVLDVVNGQVLGATDSTVAALPSTGASPLLSMLAGFVLVGIGVNVLKLR